MTTATPPAIGEDSARRMLWNACLLLWTCAAIIGALFWWADGVDPLGMVLFFAAEVAGAALLWRIDRQHQPTVEVATVMLAGSNLLFALVHWPLPLVGFAAAATAVFLLLTIGRAPHYQSGDLDDDGRLRLLGLAGGIVAIDLLAVTGVIDPAMSDSFCILWCE